MWRIGRSVLFLSLGLFSVASSNAQTYLAVPNFNPGVWLGDPRETTSSGSSCFGPGVLIGSFLTYSGSFLGSLPPLLRKDGRWLPATATDLGYLAPYVFSGSVPYTSVTTLSAAGILSSESHAHGSDVVSWNPTLDPPSADPRDYDSSIVETLDLNTGRYRLHRTDSMSTTIWGWCAVHTTTTTDLTRVFPVNLVADSPPQANLVFTNPHADTISSGAAPAAVDPVAAAFAPPAAALSADGVSAAVIVFRSNSNAPVTLSLGAGSPGALSSYLPDFLSAPHPGTASQVTVSQPAFCTAGTNDCYFLALVWPPQTMPVTAADLDAGRIPTVIVSITATQSGASVQSSLTVLPPPVAMVHGMWSSGAASWPSFAHWLALRYPHRLVGVVDYEADNFRSFTHPSVQGALQGKIADLLQSAANQGLVARKVDVVAHSMGGLITRWLMTHASGNLATAVHRLITVGTPHQGSPLATELWLRKDDEPAAWTVGWWICLLRQISPCTLKGLLASEGRTVDGAIASLQPASSELNQLNATATDHRAIVGVAPSSSDTETALNALLGSFIPSATVGGILGVPHDIIVAAESQMAAASDSATIANVVHASLSARDTSETASLDVWRQALYWLMGGTGVATRSDSSSEAIRDARDVMPDAPLPDFDLTGKTNVPATEVTFAPATGSTLNLNTPVDISAVSTTRTVTEIFLFQTIVDPTDVPLLYATQVPFAVRLTPTRLGTIDFTAFAVFSDNTYAAVPLHYVVQSPGLASSLSLSGAPVASLPVGFSTTIRAIALLGTVPVPIDVTAAARFLARSGSPAVFSVGAGGVLTANGRGVDWLDVSYDGKTASAPVRVGVCSYRLSPVNQIIANTGASATIQVTATPGCAWTGATADTWIGIDSASGTGDGTIQITASPNGPGNGTRVGFVTLAEQTVAVTQPDQACTYTVSPAQIDLPAEGGNGTIGVSTSCPVTASSSADWLLPTSLPFLVAYTALPNPAASPRTAILTVGTRPIAVTQEPAGAGEPNIFRDGFESGDTSVWSAVAP